MRAATKARPDKRSRRRSGFSRNKRGVIGLGKFCSGAPGLSSHKNYLPDSELDLSDIPEATDEELRRARRVGRPVTGNTKHLIAIRIAPRVLARLRRLAAKQSKPYQTFIHEILESVDSRKVASATRAQSQILFW